MISSLEKGAELGKIDIKQAFRLLIVNPTDFDLLGILFEGKYWVDKNLPMGCFVLMYISRNKILSFDCYSRSCVLETKSMLKSI
jgi:hypothetical protein